MDLPTYTNIWRIEKRLYKLYDLRLPMPLPLVQIGVFVGVFVPWILLLQLVGVPFRTPWHVLYLVPPGVLTWLATRPVIEGKRLTELLLSQSRYLAEPRTWCRLTPIREPAEVMVTARVWRRADGTATATAAAERAALRSRRGRKTRRGAAEEIPAARHAPVPLAESASAVRHAPAPLSEAAPAAATRPAAPLGYRERPAESASAGRRAARTWRSGAPRDISHEAEGVPAVPADRRVAGAVPPPAGPAERFEEREPAPAERERPPATPVLEVPPARRQSEPGSGKRALASGVRRPGAAAEFWQAIAPPPVPDPADRPAARAADSPFGATGHHPPAADEPADHGTPAPPPSERTPAAPALPERASSPPPPERVPAAPERAPGAPAAPERGSRAPAVPDRASGVPALPERGFGAPAAPERGTGAPALPERASGTPALSERASDGPALPERGSGAPVAPERGTGAPALPERASGMPAVPGRGSDDPVLPERASGAPAVSERASDVPVVPEGGAGAQVVPEGGSGRAAEPEWPSAEQVQSEGATVGSAPSEGAPAGRGPSERRSAASDLPEGASAASGEGAGGEAVPEEGAPAAPGTAPVTRPDIPQAPPTTVPDIPMVPGAFGAGRPAQSSADEPEPARADEEAETSSSSAGPRAPAAAESGRDADAAERAEDGAEEQPRQRSPRPWSEGLSRPLRAARTDAMIWPPLPPPGRPGAASGPPAPQPGTPVRGTGRNAPAVPPPAEPVRETGAPGHDVPTAPEVPAARSETPPAVRPGSPAGPVRQGPPAGPARPPAASGPPQVPWRGARPPLPEPVGADSPWRDGPPVDDEQPPALEVRSGPASPVRPRPLPNPPPAQPDQAAITPPDPEQEAASGGLRRLIQAVGGGHSQVDQDYQERLQRPFQGTRHIVVLGCTGGAGQTVTALMLGHTFAQYCGEPIVAIDVNPGPGALARRTRSETHETLTGLITRADQVNSLTAMRRYTSQAKSGLDVIAAGKNPLQALDDRDYALAIRTIDRFYSITMLDAAAAVVARVLPHADQIVLVAPASGDAPRAVAMTFEWLDGHGYEELRSRAVTVINGVSRRSMDDVEQAEAVARGRCRALVRIPWDDHLSMDRSPRNELKSLRSPTRRAYLALAGVVAGGFSVVPERYEQPEQEQEASR